MLSRIYLIRHGRTDGNRNHWYYGATDLPLTEDGYLHLRKKIDGCLIKKTRYKIPYENNLTIELDIFMGYLAPLILAEVEFDSEEAANAFVPPAWFGEDVTFSSEYHNSTLSRRTFIHNSDF